MANMSDEDSTHFSSSSSSPHFFPSSRSSEHVQNLILAAQNGNLEDILKYGDDINVKDRHGMTALEHVSKRGQVKIASLLIDNGANNFGKALPYATENGHFAITKLLITNDADPNSIEGQTALRHACRAGFDEIAKLLLEKGSDVNAKNFRGETPLIQTTKVSIAKLLLEYGADVNAKTLRGQTALEKIRETFRHSTGIRISGRIILFDSNLILLLLEHGAETEYLYFFVNCVKNRIDEIYFIRDIIHNHICPNDNVHVADIIVKFANGLENLIKYQKSNMN